MAKRTKAESFAAALAAAEDEIAELDLETLSVQEKNTVLKAVDSLRQTLNAFFSQVGQSPGSRNQSWKGA